MQTDIRDISSVKKEIRVSFAPEAVQSKLDSAFQRLKQKARVKGFRPGKAPIGLIKQQYGGDVEREVIGDLISSSLADVIKENKFPAVAYPVLEKQQFEAKSGLEYQVTLEVKPELEIKGYDSLKLEKDTKLPGEKEVESVLNQLRDKQAVLKDKQEKKAAKGDHASISVELFVDGEPYKEAGVDDRMVALGEEQLLPELDAAALAMQVGEKREVEIPFPKEHADKKLAGKKTTFHLTLNSLKEKELPKLDDDFAKATGEATSLAELKQKITDNLTEEAENLEKRRLEDVAVDELLESNPFEVPPSLLKRRVDYLKQQWQQAGFQPKDKQEGDKMEAEAYNRALREVRVDLMLESIADQEKLSVADADLEKHIEEMVAREAKRYPDAKPEDLHRLFASDERKEMVREQLLQRRTLDFIMSKATMESKPQKESKKA